jgi:hypothetical protein
MCTPPCENALQTNLPAGSFPFESFTVKFKAPVKFAVIDVTGIADSSSGSKEKTVEYTWQYSLPSELVAPLHQSPRAGRATVRLFDDGWRVTDFGSSTPKE